MWLRCNVTGALYLDCGSRSISLGLLVLVEQHDHQPCAAAEPAEQGALADAGRRRDFVHGDRVWAARGDEPACRVHQQGTIARGVPALVRRVGRLQCRVAAEAAVGTGDERDPGLG
jgi:hypothetical protein